MSTSSSGIYLYIAILFSSAFQLHDRRSSFLTGVLETSFSCSKANSTNASSDL